MSSPSLRKRLATAPGSDAEIDEGAAPQRAGASATGSPAPAPSPAASTQKSPQPSPAVPPIDTSKAAVASAAASQESPLSPDGGGGRGGVNNALPQTQPFLQEAFIDAFYNPHTITLLILSLGAIVYFAFLQFSETYTTEQNVKRGLTAALLFFFVYAVSQFKDGIMLRPHPAVWRLVLGASVVYLFVLIFLLFQSRDFARHLLTYLYPQLGRPLPERSYATDCSVFTWDNPESIMKNVKDTVFDEFILAHIIGYAAKALMFRDMKLLWILSLMFELAEITWQHWLENFKECWWDHLIIDVLICNLGGMIIGLKICDYFNVKKYPRWIGVSQIRDTKGKLLRVVRQFTPYNWTNYRWEALRDGRHFAYMCLVVAIMLTFDLNAFFLKYVLWVPPLNPLNTYRLILLLAIGIPTTREFYEFIDNPRCKRLGTQAWVAVAICLTELFISIKFSAGMFTEPYPNHIWVPWLVAGSLFVVWFVLYFFVLGPYPRGASRVFLRLIMTTIVLSLVFMFFAGCPDIQFMQKEFDAAVDRALVSFGYQPTHAIPTVA